MLVDRWRQPLCLTHVNIKLEYAGWAGPDIPTSTSRRRCDTQKRAAGESSCRRGTLGAIYSAHFRAATAASCPCGLRRGIQKTMRGISDGRLISARTKTPTQPKVNNNEPENL